MTKSGREIMEILEAYDLTGCAHSAAQLAGTDRKTVARYVALRDAGTDPLEAVRRPRSVDAFAAKVEELVDRSSGKVRADRTVSLADSFVQQILPYFDQYALSHRFWSPDSSAILLPLGSTSGQDQVTIVPADGSNPIPIGNGSMGSWSP